MTTTDRIKKLLAERCDVRAETMTDATELSELDLDSLTMLEVTLRMEQEFDTTLEPEELVTADTIGDLTRVVEIHLVT